MEDLRLDPRTSRTPAGRPLLTPIRRGAYYDAEAWGALSPDEKYAARVHATAMCARSPGHVYSHWSAAVLWHLPIIEPWPRHVHLTVVEGGAYTSGLVIRHLSTSAPPHTVKDGVNVTTVPRTVIDLAREGSLQSAVAAADCALHHGMCTRRQLQDEVDMLPRGASGVRRARTAVALADGRAESPLESLSRVAMYELRLPRPDLQVPLRDARGRFGRGDFGWDGLIGECDGHAKYLRHLRPGEDPGAVVVREKRREDRIRHTGRDVARWGWHDALTRTPMLHILEDKGLRRTPRRQWF